MYTFFANDSANLNMKLLLSISVYFAITLNMITGVLKYLVNKKNGNARFITLAACIIPVVLNLV